LRWTPHDGAVNTLGTQDRLRGFIDLLLQSLDDGADASTLAGRAFLSRFHFDRLLAAALGESPGRFRRRLLLERAAWQLASGRVSVTEAAFEANYGSTEAFTRAFQRAYGCTPSRYRATAPRGFRLSAPNGVHFHPPGGLFVPGGPTRRRSMDLTERQLEHDLWLTHRLLDSAASLPEPVLDDRLELDPLAHEPGEPTIRGLLYRLVFTKEMWTAAIAGRALPEDGDASLDGLRQRLAAAGGEFVQLVRDVRDRREWDAGFVDALCDPPESFTYSAAVSHVLTFSAYRRQLVIEHLRRLGADDVPSGDPIEWERARAGARDA
jgi:AraC family transcriptional regulator